MTFRFRPLLSLACALGVLVLIGLGTWQVQRLAWKTDLTERVERQAKGPPMALEALPAPPGAPETEYAHIAVTGGFLPDTAHLFGTYGGEPGWFVFQPFLPDDRAETVLVNRGFVRQDERAEIYELPDAPALTALVRRFESPRSLTAFLNVPPDPEGRSYYDRTRETLTGAFEPAPNRPFADYYLDSTLPTERPRGGSTRLDFSNRHLGYVFTWYGLALALAGVWAAMSWSRSR